MTDRLKKNINFRDEYSNFEQDDEFEEQEFIPFQDLYTQELPEEEEPAVQDQDNNVDMLAYYLTKLEQITEGQELFQNYPSQDASTPMSRLSFDTQSSSDTFFEEENSSSTYFNINNISFLPHSRSLGDIEESLGAEKEDEIQQQQEEVIPRGRSLTI